MTIKRKITLPIVVLLDANKLGLGCKVNPAKKVFLERDEETKLPALPKGSRATQDNARDEAVAPFSVRVQIPLQNSSRKKLEHAP